MVPLLAEILKQTGNGNNQMEGNNMKKLFAIGFALIFLLGSLTVMLGGEEEVDATPTRIQRRFFKGNISGLYYGNPEGLPSDYGLNITGTYLTNGSSFSQLGPIAINLSDNGSFTASVDAEFHDTTKPWVFTLTDCYGWDEADGGIVNVIHPSSWNAINTTYHLPNGTLWYKKGYFGNVSITAINRSSGEPLDGVGFTFSRHPLHNSRVTGNYTDSNGRVVFNNLQYGLDPLDTMTVTVEKGNFTYDEGDIPNIAKLVLVNGTTVNYEINLTENPLVMNSAPLSGQIDVPVNKNQVPNNVFIQFNDDMDQSTIDMDTLYLMERGGEKVNITYNWPTDDLCKIQPAEDLKFNTIYDIFVTPRVKNLTGYEPLWRTYSYNFTTILPPATVTCNVVINGTTDPAPEGTMIQLGNNIPEMLIGGSFVFENVVEGEYDLTVIGPTVSGVAEYLYYGNMVTGIQVDRGQMIDVPGLHVTKRPVKTAIIEVLDQDGNPLEDANVTHQITKESRFTTIDGKVTFEDVLIDDNTSFRASKENYIEWPVTVPFGPDDPTEVNVTLYEKDLPVKLSARSEFVIEIDGRRLPVDSVIQLEFDDVDGFSLEMDPETMTTDNLKIIDDNDQAIPINIVPRAGDQSKWNLEPRDLLEYDSSYTIFISEQVASSAGTNPLWRDMTVEFLTEELDPSIVSGRITVREKGIGGVPVEVLEGTTIIGSGTTDYNGNYFVAVDHSKLTLMNISVRADGSNWGLSTETLGPFVLNSGGFLNFTDFKLDRLEDWYNVLYPKDDEGRMPIEGSITLKFKTALDNSDPEMFANNFTLTSPKVPLNITLMDGGKTVLIRPEIDLDHDKIYTLSISDFQDGNFYKELVDVNGTPALIRGEKIEIITEFKPIDVILQTPSSTLIDETPINIPITMFFTNYSVNTTLVENALELKESMTGNPVGNLTFTWSSNEKSLEIGHDDFEGLTEYVLTLSAGKYGGGTSEGARIESDFIVYFTTEVVGTDMRVDAIWPDGTVGAKLTVTLKNDLAVPILVVILVEEEFGSKDYIQYANLTLAAAETDRQVTLDTEKLGKGEYLALVRIYDPDSNTLLNEYPINLNIKEKDENGEETQLWIFLVIAAIVILIIVLAIFLIMQSRKKNLDEELSEEFECPECHHLVSEDDTVCPHCGAEFEEQAYKCPKCGSMLDPEDEECPECGYDFEDQEKMELEDDDEEDSEMELDEDENDDEMELEDEEEEDEDIEEMEEEDED